MDLRKGEILSILGENGSGKTTLMNILSGIYYPDEGQIFINGREVTITSPKDAYDLGIGMIHQHFKLVDILNATENIILGLPGKGRMDIKKSAARVKEIADRYGFEIDPFKKIYEMSVSEKQTVEIVKVLYRGANILILDEPTAVLTPQETEKLFDVLRKMRTDGHAIIIITHKLDEVMKISDRVTILRKGKYIDTVTTAETSRQELTDMMVGKKVEFNISRPEPHDVTERLSIEGLTCTNVEGLTVVDNVSFKAYSGEILGIAGISGSGQRELLEAISGLTPKKSGRIIYTPKTRSSIDITNTKPSEIMNMGVRLSFVPEDRFGMGLVGSMGMTGNMMLRSYEKEGHVFVDRKHPRELAEKIIKDLEVVTPGINTPVRKLSGGNAQKVLVGREIASRPRVLMAAYAVRGLDINSSYTIYRLLNEQKERGAAVIYVGEDLDVLVALCDRILVLCGGKVSGIVDGRTTTKEELGRLMTTVREEAEPNE